MYHWQKVETRFEKEINQNIAKAKFKEINSSDEVERIINRLPAEYPAFFLGSRDTIPLNQKKI